jgi:hypothetical protein
MEVEQEKILALKAFFLAHKIYDNSVSKPTAMNMIDSAIEQLKQRDTTKDRLNLAFYHLVRSEVVRDLDQDTKVIDRKAAQQICNELDNPLYNFFMKIESAVVIKKSLHGISTLNIVDEGEMPHRDIAANALDLVWRRLSYEQIDFIDHTTLAQLFDEHGLTY